jgi:anti-anti-sigma factor
MARRIGGKTMNGTAELIEVERQGDTLILTPRADLGELSCAEIEAEQARLLQLLAADPSIRNVLVDFARTDYFGSTALAMLVRLVEEAGKRGGRLAFCNLSAHERDVLAATRLTEIGTGYPSRREALEALAP